MAGDSDAREEDAELDRIMALPLEVLEAEMRAAGIDPREAVEGVRAAFIRAQAQALSDALRRAQEAEARGARAEGIEQAAIVWGVARRAYAASDCRDATKKPFLDWQASEHALLAALSADAPGEPGREERADG